MQVVGNGATCDSLGPEAKISKKKKKIKKFLILKFDSGSRLSQDSLHFPLLRTQKTIPYISKLS